MPKSASNYFLDTDGTFVIEDYNHANAFSNFFPGIAGIWGIPMWVFYVNRGQGICSLGIESKDKAILEFHPANKAFRVASMQGFRTFLKVSAKGGSLPGRQAGASGGRSKGKTIFWEPFQNNIEEGNSTQRMLITSHDMTIEDINPKLGLKVSVNYFTVPNESFAALARVLTIENMGKKSLSLDVIDGLPLIIPFGIKDWVSKNMSRTAEAWMQVRNLKEKVPFYQLNVEISDTSQVKHIKEGNFYLSFAASGRSAKLLDVVVEPACVFGQADDFRIPENYLKSKSFSVPKEQQTANRTPSAMSFGQFHLSGGKKVEIVSLVGHAHDNDHLKKITKKIISPDYMAKKAKENKDVIDGIKNYALTASDSSEFNLYSQQTFLDNVLRGGLPVTLPALEGNVSFNVFSRKHGDLERDYNYFTLSPTYYSQGNGNYRDVNQNRRNDVWFNPQIKDSGIISFFSLIQADGYNPLVVKGVTFVCENSNKLNELLDKSLEKSNREKIKEMLLHGFQPGELLSFIEHNRIALKTDAKVFLTEILNLSRKNELAEHGEGFWSDHWTYNLDLLQSYLSLYPEELKALLLEKKVFSFYHNTHYVLPRDHRYILTAHGVRQYHSVFNDVKIRAKEGGYKLRLQHGQGEVYYTHLLEKILCLISNKVSTLDPSGIGIEMEADKPNWYDALNGLPGLLGSSISETFELKRFSLFLLNALNGLSLKDSSRISLCSEMHHFLTKLIVVLEERDPLTYWSKSNDIKEEYRKVIHQGIAGQEEQIEISEIKRFLKLVIARTDAAAANARNKEGLYPTYLYHEVTNYEKVGQHFHKDAPYVRPLKFKRHDLPLFLEGFVHGLRVEAESKNVKQAQALYRKVLKSPLYDKKLKMYKVNADLSSQPEDIGRTRNFPPGWLENESIWLHMEYKYLLEILRAGLYEEFFENFKNALIPFLNPGQYGRSTLENSSFIVSSAHEDADLHGRGFVARLSGSTAEFLHMWLYMNVGQDPFYLNEKHQLQFSFKPVLPGWLFTKKGSYSFNLFAATLVAYHNPARRNTFGPKGCKVKNIALTYRNQKESIRLNVNILPANHAQDLREGKIEKIDVYFE